MRYLVRFVAFTLLVIIVAWGLAIYTVWWIGMFVLTMLVIVLAGQYLTEVVENYIID